MLEVQHISKFYGDKMAIQDISFTAREGEIIGLLGHNGCGKSTTMNIITNCLTPSEGDVLLDGVSVLQNPVQTKKKIGYLPEIPPVYPDLTVDEQLQFACGLRGIPRKEVEDQIASACADLNITGVRGRLIHNLSKGYRQRVGFAQALIGRPQLLVFDEPTVGLDPQQIMELRELIVRLKERHTVIISSHILSEIAATCDRIVVLSNGKLVADGTLQGLLHHAGGQNRLILQADGDMAGLCVKIRSIAGVLSSTLEKDDRGETQILIETEPGRDIHRPLFALLTQEQSPVRMLKSESASLEEVFLKLTQDRRYES